MRGAPRLLCTRTRIASLAAIPHIPYDMCETDSPCAARDHERLRTARRLAATYGGIGAAWLEASPRQSRRLRRPFRGGPSAGHESRLRGTRNLTKWRQEWVFRVCSCRASGPLSCPAGMSSPSGRGGCVTADETKSQDRTRRGRRRSPPAIRHAQPDFVVARQRLHHVDFA